MNNCRDDLNGSYGYDLKIDGLQVLGGLEDLCKPPN